MNEVTDTEQSDSPSYSRLAWELARTAHFSSGSKDQVKATVTLSDGDRVHGFGATTTQAMRRLASALMVLAR